MLHIGFHTLLLFQIVGISVLLLTLHFLQNLAVMRGLNRRPLNDLAGGILVFLYFKIYTITYVDLSEIYGGRKNLWGRKSTIWSLLRNRFNIECIKTTELNPKHSYIIGLHPHGILPFGGMSVFMDDNGKGFSFHYPQIDFRILAASVCFYTPGYRDFLLSCGVVDASRFSAIRALESGKSLVIVPGGATEALYSDPDEDVLLLSNRTGFIRLALAFGAHLVPIFTFNENNSYDQLSLENKLVAKTKKWFQKTFGLSLPLPKHIIPRSTKMTCVVGEPIPVEVDATPTPEKVMLLLNKYILAVTALYEKYGPIYNIPSTKPPLRIV